MPQNDRTPTVGGAHLSEGELHTYLDGALDLLDDGRQREVRAHLDRCRACRDRLAVESAVRDRAEAILGADDPLAGVSLPCLVDLRVVAGGVVVGWAGGVGRRRTLAPALGWAATVVLSLGVGYGIGVVGPSASLPEAGRAAGDASAVQATPLSEQAAAGIESEADARRDERSVDETTSVETAPLAEQAAALPTAARERVAAPPLAAEPLPAPPAAAVSEPGRVDDAPPAAAKADPATEPDTNALLAQREPLVAVDSTLLQRTLDVLDTVAGRGGETALRSERTGTAAALARTREQLAQQQRSRVTSAGAPLDLSAPPRDIAPTDLQRPDADAPAGLALALPGLTIDEIRWREVWPGQEGLVVLQRLADGRRVELRVAGRPVGGDEPVLEPPVDLEGAAPGWARAVREVSGGWAALDGPLPAAELTALLEALRQTP